MTNQPDVHLKKEVKKPELPSASNFPLPKLVSPYRSDTQPFTTYIPYQPLHREQHIQLQPQPQPSPPQQQQDQQLELNQQDEDHIYEKEQQEEEKQQQPVQLKQEYEPEQQKQPDVQSSLALETQEPPPPVQPQPQRQSIPALSLPRQQQQQLLLQQRHQQTRPPGSSVIIFRQDKPKRTISKKSDKPFVCTNPGCTWAFARHSDLTRHSKSHAPPQYQCPYWKNDPTCHKKDGAFNRLDVLKRHLRLIHYVRDKQPIGDLNPGDDPGWCRSCQRMFPNSKTFVEHCEDCAQNTTPTEWIEIKKEGASANPNQATFRVNLKSS